MFPCSGQLPRNYPGAPVREGTACAPRTAMFALRPNTISARLPYAIHFYIAMMLGCQGNNGHKTMGAQSRANHRGELHMRRREFLKYSAATALAGSVGYRAARADLPTVKVVVIGAKTGPLAPALPPHANQVQHAIYTLRDHCSIISHYAPTPSCSSLV